VVTFLHVYVIEAHPMAPDVSPYSGQVWEVEYSTLTQAVTDDARVEHARQTLPLLEGKQLQVVDGLDVEGRRVNPVWCTYGTAPNATYVIGKDGVVTYAHGWTDADSLEAAIRALGPL
jgi:peroxiredoxin